MKLLQFSKGNAKLNRQTAIFDLVAGWSCCGAKDCLMKVDRHTGKMIVSSGKFRCYAASAELYSPAARRFRWRNFDLLRKLKNTNDIYKLLKTSISKNAKNAGMFRLHSSGDFFSQNYFDAWVKIAKENPDKIFYAYTKSLRFWVKRLNSIPVNFKLTASKGGKDDALINKHNLKFNEVVLSEQEAKDKGLELDHDDSHAYNSDKSFAILIHGTQPAGSQAMSAIMTLRKKGVMGYTRGSKAGGREIRKAA